jgi:hypothetical protein
VISKKVLRTIKRFEIILIHSVPSTGERAALCLALFFKKKFKGSGASCACIPDGILTLKLTNKNYRNT